MPTVMDLLIRHITMCAESLTEQVAMAAVDVSHLALAAILFVAALVVLNRPD